MAKPNPTSTQSDEFYDIRIARDGTWFYAGTPIGRHNLVKLFSRVLKKDEKGDYWLVTPYERGRITVEDAPFMAVEVQETGAGQDQQLKFRTNVDDWVTADIEHPLRVTYDTHGHPSPYILVRQGLEARLTRAVYYELARLAVESPEQKGVYGVWSAQHFYPIGSLE